MVHGNLPTAGVALSMYRCGRRKACELWPPVSKASHAAEFFTIVKNGYTALKQVSTSLHNEGAS